MICGLGSSGNLVIEGFHGVEFDRPLRRLKEYTEIIKMALSGQRINYEGEIYTLQRGAHRSVADLTDAVERWVADWNADPRLFVWNKTADQIFDNPAGYLNRTPDPGH